MIIKFENVIPNPMKGEQFSSESAWGNTCVVDSSHSYFLKSGSGKGKSTFSAYIIGLRSDYAGTITLNGQDQKRITLDEWSELRQRKLAFLAQDMRLFPGMTLQENLLIKNQLTHFKTEAEIDNLLQQLEMDHKKLQMAGTLSLGQQQRVALIRALLQPYELLLMDEPFSHIDDANIERAIAMIVSESKAQNAGYVLTSLGSDHGIENNKTITL